MSLSRRRKKGLLTGSLALLAAGATGVGILAATGGAANAALGFTSAGGPVPVFIDAGPISLPDQANSIKARYPDLNVEECIPGPFDPSVNIDPDFRAFEGSSIELTAYSDGSCQGATVGGPGVAYRISYDGPDPTSGNFTQVLVHILNPAVFVCTDEGWTDNNPAICRNDG